MTWNLPRLLSLLAVTAALTILPLGDGAHATTEEGETAGDPSNIWFQAPLPNAAYDEAPADVEVIISVYQGTEDLGVGFVTLSIDGVEGEQLSCVDGCTFNVSVEQGMHTLSVVSEPAVYDAYTIIYVDEEPPGGESGSGESGSGESGSGSESGSGESESSGSGSGESESESGSGGSTSSESGSGGNADADADYDGGGCSVGGDPSTPWALLALPALLLLPGVRRRRGASRA